MIKFKKLGLLALIFSLVFISNPSHAVKAQNIVTTNQSTLMEYVYDSNNRLVEIKKAGVTIAFLTYDKNGNLLRIQIVS
ncbi:MAG: hypothetical protein K0S61_2676 [Anaerocolumna sp.]|jgi:YD repeat-containing protein|nr:hypothetical protein [Anaerocolumna sp.]